MRQSLALALAVGLFGCGASHDATPRGDGARTSPGSTLSLFPAGASLLVRARLRRLFASSATFVVADALLPPDLRDRFARRTGVEIDEVDEVVYAEYPGGYLAVAQGSWPAADVVRGASRRMNTEEVRTSRPWVRRAGWIGGERYDLVALDMHRVAVANGTSPVLTTLLRRAGSRRHPPVEGSAFAVPPFAVPPFARLLSAHRDAPVALFGPRPEALPEGVDVETLTRGMRAFAVTLRPEGPTPGSPSDPLAAEAETPLPDLTVTVDCRGRFPPTAAENFRNLVRSVAETDLGTALGMDAAPESLTVQLNDGGVLMTFGLDSERLAWGLRVLVGGDLEGLLAASH